HIYYDSDCKEIIDFFEWNFFNLDFIPDRMDRLGSTDDSEWNIKCVQFGFEGCDKIVDIIIAIFLGLLQFLGNRMIGVWFRDLHAQILKLSLEIVQSQSMCQWRIYI